MVAKIFIDGEAGTTGLQIRDRLATRTDIELLSIAPEHRKDLTARADLLNSADIAILCLPDEAAKQSVSLIENDTTRVIDASTAHRVEAGWVYGFAEMDREQSAKIANAQRVANPGCWPQGLIALLRPLIAAKLVPNDYPASFSGVSGYSGGGRQMIEDYEANGAQKPEFMPYSLGLEHKHVPEMIEYAGLGAAPLFQPAVGNFAQGMLSSAPLHLDMVAEMPSGAQLHACLADHYAQIEHGFVELMDYTQGAPAKPLDPQALNGTNKMQLFVFANDDNHQAILMAIYDNLGKGASGAAVQNMNLMIGAAADQGL